jgi:hypothetical protein
MPICEPESIYEGPSLAPDDGDVALEVSPVAAPARRHRRHPWVVAAFLAVVCAAAWLAVVVLLRDGGVAAAPTHLEPLTFEFQAAQRHDHLLLTWNRTARAVHDATGATLSIHDGPETEDVELNLDTLRRGGVAYYPIFEDSSFRLTLTYGPRGSASEQAHASFRP